MRLITSCRWPLSRATTRHSRSRAPVTLCASRTSGTSRRSSTASSSRPWTISRKTNASDRVAELGRVEVGPEARDDAARLELLEPRRDRPARDAEPARRAPARRSRGSSRSVGDDPGIELVDRAGHVVAVSSGSVVTDCALCARRTRHSLPVRAPSAAGRSDRPSTKEEPMFEEGQLYSPVTHDEDGKARRPPRRGPPGLQRPRLPRAPQRDRHRGDAAGRPASRPRTIAYTDAEDDVWRTVSPRAAHEARAVRRAASSSRRRRALGLPEDRVPQLDEVTARLRPLTGFELRTRPPGSSRCASSTARSPTASSTPRSTSATRPSRSTRPSPTSSTRSSATGTCSRARASPSSSAWPATAARRVQTDEALQFIADVFWFTLEFGVVWEDGELRAYGAGILSSYGEIEEFRHMEIRPLDFGEMGTIGVRHHEVPAGPLRGRLDGPPRRGGRRVLRGGRRRDAVALRARAALSGRVGSGCAGRRRDAPRTARAALAVSAFRQIHCGYPFGCSRPAVPQLPWPTAR